jgi:hypothetical protein
VINKLLHNDRSLVLLNKAFLFSAVFILFSCEQKRKVEFAGKECLYLQASDLIYEPHLNLENYGKYSSIGN